MPAASLFSLLGLDPSSTDAALRAAYKRRVAELHPDRNPGFPAEATRACALLTAAFAAYRADPAAYRAQHAGAPPAPDPEPEAEGESPPMGIPELDDAIGFAASLVELFAPADRLPAARRAIMTGTKIAKRYASRRG